MLAEDFPPGSRWRVTRLGAWLSGLEPQPGYHSGWSRWLAVGEVIEVDRVAPGWGSDPGPPVVQWSEPGVQFVEFRPSVGTFWSPRPDVSYLERIDD